MPATRKTTKKPASSGETLLDASMAFTKAINSIIASQDSFQKRVDDLKAMTASKFEDLQLKIQKKQEELDATDRKLAERKRIGTLDIDLKLRQYGYEAAKKILEERAETAIRVEDYKELQHKYGTLKANFDADVRKAVAKEEARGKRHIEELTKNLELKNKAEVATVEAKLATQNKHIEVLEKNIGSMERNLQEARNLTKSVASSFAASKSMFLPNMAK